MKIRIYPFSNGSAYGWNKLRSLFDFFFPYSKQVISGKVYHRIRKEAATYADNMNGVTSREFYTFRAFAWHYIYTFLINPLRKLQLFFLNYSQIRYELLAFLALQNPKFIPLIALPIAFDAFGSGSALPGTSVTFSHTTGGSDRIILVGTNKSGNETDDITGVTYAAVSTTLIASIGAGATLRAYMWILVNPTSETNDVVVSSSASQNIRCTSVSYTGAKQTGQPDASATNSGTTGTSITTTVTTVADNCWDISFLGSSSSAAKTAGAGIGSYRGNVNSIANIGDSNAVISPAGAHSMTWEGFSEGDSSGVVQASIAPVAVAGGTSGLMSKYWG